MFGPMCGPTFGPILGPIIGSILGFIFGPILRPILGPDPSLEFCVATMVARNVHREKTGVGLRVATGQPGLTMVNIGLQKSSGLT